MRRVTSIAEVDRAAWDRLAAADPYARHQWLLTLEKTAADAARRVYLLLEADGELQGAAVGYRFDGRSPTLVDDLLFGRLRGVATRLGLGLGPALLCAPLLGLGRHLLWRRGDPRAVRIVASLLDALERYAATERLTLAVAKLPRDEKKLVEALAARDYAASMNWPVSYLELCGESFDDYLAGVPPGMANKLRRECAAPAGADVRIARETRFELIAGPLHRLVEANHRSYSAEPLGLAESFFTILARHHGANAIVTVARAGAEIVGGALLLAAGTCAGGSLIGVKQDGRNRRAFTYFNLAFYAPIRWCFDNGVRRLYLGAGLYDMKRRRGCRLLPLLMYIRHRSSGGRAVTRLFCALHQSWVVRKLEREGVRLRAAPGPRGRARS